MVKAEELLKVAKEHPGLPMISMVDSEVVADDGYSYWLGQVTNVEVDYINTDTDRVLIKSVDDEEDILYAFDKCWDDLPEAAQDKILADVKWTEAIIIWIGV